MLRELDRVSHQIDQQLANPARIPDQRLRNIRLHFVDQLQSLLLDSEAQGFHRFAQAFAQIEGDRFHLHFPRFDFGEIQNVIDDR